MSKNDRTYQHEDVTQAIVSALLFGEDAGLAAMTAHDGNLSNEVTAIYPAANVVIHISPEAAKMLARAQVSILESRKGGMFTPRADRINHFMLDESEPALDDEDRAKLSELFGILSDTFGKGEETEAADIDMSEVTPGNTERVYTDQPIPEREA